MTKRILLACYEIPGYGGAATAAYQLFHALQRDDFDVHYLNLVDAQDGVYFEYTFGSDYGNPQLLDHVSTCVLNDPLYFPHPELSQHISEIKPDLMIGVGFIAALLVKRACPGTTTIFLTTGCQQVKDAVTARMVTDWIAQERYVTRGTGSPGEQCREEREAALISDFIVTHSDTTLSVFHYFYSYLLGKIYSRPVWFAEWIYREASHHIGFTKPFRERDIDCLFVSSSWARPEKNYALIQTLARRLAPASIHLAGETEDDEDLISGVRYHGLVTKRDQLFELMGRAKTVVSPSLYDSAPGILFEASAMGCNIVASRNCGNWMICNEQLLVDPFSGDQFVKSITLSLSKKFDDNMKFFLETESYRQFVEIIEVL